MQQQATRLTGTRSWGLASGVHRRRRDLAETIVARQREQLPGLAASDSEERAHDARVAEAEALLEHLAQAMALTDPILFLDQVAWVKQALAAHGVPATAVRQNLEFMIEALEEELPPDSLTPAVSLVRDVMTRLDSAPESPPVRLGRQGPLGETARAYCDCLLAGDDMGARALVRARIADGTPAEAILVHVIEPAQHELGRLWQIGEISVAQEHFATAAGQRLMAELAGAVRPGGGAPAGTLVAACVDGELHDVGLRLVSDVFQLHGWRSHYLGACTPNDAILEAVRRQRPDLLALSVTISHRTWHLTELIARLRREPEVGRTPVLVGGYPFKVSPSLAAWIGADACAGSAQEALLLADRLIAV